MIKFSDINTTEDMISYMGDSKRFNSIELFCQYTSIYAIKSILSSGYWFISNPRNMNDAYEYSKFKDGNNWDNIFFASFILRQTESVGMWSMYGQPWSEGVMVSIPRKAFFKWIREIKSVYAADKDTKKVDKNHSVDIQYVKKSLIRVLYTDDKKLTYTGREYNSNFENPYQYSELTGFVKDISWDYEREARVRFDLPDWFNAEAIAIEVPEEIRKQFIITKGPRYETTQVSRMISSEYASDIDVQESKLTEKLKWVPCDSCKYKKSVIDSASLISI